MSEKWRVTWGVVAVAVGGFWIYYLSNSTVICQPSRMSDGRIEVSCVRHWNEQAQVLLDAEPTSFINNTYDWARIRELGERRETSN